MGDFYGDLYETLYSQIGYDAGMDAWEPHYLKIVSKATQTFSPPSTMLDVGCSRGVAMRAFAAKGYQTHGIDVAPSVIAECCEKGLQCKVGSGTGIPYETGFFDFIICTDVLEHILKADIPKVSSEFHRVLKPNGMAFVRIAKIPECDRTALDKLHSLGGFKNVSNLHVSCFSSQEWIGLFAGHFAAEVLHDEARCVDIALRRMDEEK